MDTIRNFAIIAHVDHGKSTLADRLLELTNTVQGSHEEQMLDRNPISRERGITIKLAPVRMDYIDNETKQSYILNLIDTPGHVDFSYEVDRTLACVEGVILLVDATQGIQAQTIANAYKALEKDLVIIPVVNKIDMQNAQVQETKQELVDFLGVKHEEIFEISAKTGKNVPMLLEHIVKQVPSPVSTKHITTEALIFDSYFDKHKGVVSFIRMFSGQTSKHQKLRLIIGKTPFDAQEVGIFTPDLVAKSTLSDGEIGYIVTNLKDIHNVRVGDTISDNDKTKPLPGYKEVKPMVYASIFPTDTNDFEHLKRALEKIYLTDSALTFTGIYSKALGAGFRVGFLGLLHADVVRERLEREYELSLILTPPQVEYKMDNESYQEPIVRLTIFTPEQYIGDVTQLAEYHRATFINMDNKNQVLIEYEMPMSEMISDFFDKLKSITSGYASFDWEFLRYCPVSADHMSLLINGDEVPEFSEVVVPERAQEKAQFITKRLKELIPRQQFEVRIQAEYKGRIIASERVTPFRKNVLLKGSKKVGGGDYSRKQKLLTKQKRGKKRMKSVGNVEIPKEAFVKLFNK